MQKALLREKLQANRTGNTLPTHQDEMRSEQFAAMTANLSSPIYIITSGKADVVLTTSVNQETVIETLRVGDSFGYSRMLQVLVSA